MIFLAAPHAGLWPLGRKEGPIILLLLIEEKFDDAQLAFV